MNAPPGMRPLTAIEDDIKQWLVASTTKRDVASMGGDGYHCNECGAIIQQTTLYASVHEAGWPNCAGYGEVVNLSLPYCPNCEPNVPQETQRTCIHQEAA